MKQMTQTMINRPICHFSIRLWLWLGLVFKQCSRLCLQNWLENGRSNRCIGENPILRATLQVWQLLKGTPYTGRSKGVRALFDQFDRPWYVRGFEGQEEEGDCNLTPGSQWHQDGAVLGVGHQRQMTLHPLHQQELITTVSTVNHS